MLVFRVFFITVLVALAACGGGSKPTDSASLDGPVLSALTKSQPDAQTVALSFQYSDANSTQLQASLQLSLDDGATWLAAPGVPTQTLVATDQVQTHTVTWQFNRAVGIHQALVRVAVSDGFSTTNSEAVSVSGQAQMRNLARDIDSYMIYYSTLNDAIIDQAKSYGLVIVHPFQANITAGEVRRIQRGNDPNSAADDVVVLCYISIGEDSRTFGMTDEQMLTDPAGRFAGDGSGPMTDPRGPGASGQSLLNLNPQGIPSTGGLGFAPYYLDDNDYDGSPDRNGNFSVAFVNAGHPQWYQVIDAMTFAADGVPGLNEMLSYDTSDNKRGLGCDGLFLDTIDTAAPNSFTDSSSVNQSEFEWTAGGFRDFMQRLRTDYPDKLILQNRGLFFFNSVFPHYELNTRSLIDFVLFESYRLDSSTEHGFHPYFHPDNKFNFRPRLMAEAQRSDGFRVLSLGYAEAPEAEMSHDTLLNPSGRGLGYDSLIQDIVEAEQDSGFRHYLTDEQIMLVNDFVRVNAQREDTTAPAWYSTYNAYIQPWPTPATAPDPRIGIQQVVPGPALGEVTVRWDLALDYNGIDYVLYYQDQPFDFGADPNLSTATQVVLQGSPGAGYSGGPGPSVYANEALISGLTENQPYYFVVRARDSVGNQDTNEVALSATPLSTPRQYAIAIDGDFADWASVPVIYGDNTDAVGSSGPDWLDIKLANDDDELFVYTSYADAFTLNGNHNLYIDVDNNPATGFVSGSLSGLGADFLIQNGNLYSMATGSTFVTTWVKTLAANPYTATNQFEMAVSYTDLGIANNGQVLGMAFVSDGSVEDFAPEVGTPIQFLLAQAP